MFSFSCVSLVESLSREIVENQTVSLASARECFVNDIVYRVNLTFFRKLMNISCIFV